MVLTCENIGGFRYGIYHRRSTRSFFLMLQLSGNNLLKTPTVPKNYCKGSTEGFSSTSHLLQNLRRGYTGFGMTFGQSHRRYSRMGSSVIRIAFKSGNVWSGSVSAGTFVQGEFSLSLPDQADEKVAWCVNVHIKVEVES